MPSCFEHKCFFYKIGPWFQFELGLCWFCECHHKMIIKVQANTIVILALIRFSVRVITKLL